MKRIQSAVLVVSLALGASACNRESAAPPVPPTPPPAAAPAPPVPAPLAVGAISTGKAIGIDKRVIEATSEFAPTDTLYVSIETTGAASAPRTLAARWTFEDGQVVKEDSQSIQPYGPATHEFNLSKPDGWPTGKYTVSITLDGQPAGARELEVK
jgi:hypothetical protein